VAGILAYLGERPHGSHSSLLEPTLRRLIRPPIRTRFDEPDLKGFVTVLGGSLLLDNQAGTRLHHRDGHRRPVRGEDLVHAHLFADDSVCSHLALLARLTFQTP